MGFDEVKQENAGFVTVIELVPEPKLEPHSRFRNWNWNHVEGFDSESVLVLESFGINGFGTRTSRFKTEPDSVHP